MSSLSANSEGKTKLFSDFFPNEPNAKTPGTHYGAVTSCRFTALQTLRFPPQPGPPAVALPYTWDRSENIKPTTQHPQAGTSGTEQHPLFLTTMTYSQNCGYLCIEHRNHAILWKQSSTCHWIFKWFFFHSSFSKCFFPSSPGALSTVQATGAAESPAPSFLASAAALCWCRFSLRAYPSQRTAGCCTSSFFFLKYSNSVFHVFQKGLTFFLHEFKFAVAEAFPKTHSRI